jgi:DNA invertase Pin-like site-specific DNA recombinase
MTKVALYARYSSDNQSVASINDQFRVCREYAAREKWRVVGAYKDPAISGASVTLRPGVQALLQDAQRRKFDIVLAEALDRISVIRPTSRSCSSPCALPACGSSLWQREKSPSCMSA